MAQTSAQMILNWRKTCWNNSSQYYDTQAYLIADYSSTTNSSTNAVTYTITRIRVKTSAQDHGYYSYCPSENGKCLVNCYNTQVYVADNASGSCSFLCNLPSHQDLIASYDNYHPKVVNISFTLQPGESRNVLLGYSTNTLAGRLNAYAYFSNTNSRPVQDTAPSVSTTCSPASNNAYAIVVSARATCGTCNGVPQSYCLQDTIVYADSGYTQRVASGSGSIGGLTPNTKYWTETESRTSCGSAKARCSVVTLTPNTLSDATAISATEGTVRLFVTYGGATYEPTTTVRIKKCSETEWKIARVTTTKSVEQVSLPLLEPETCYQVQAITKTVAGEYYGNVVQFMTGSKGATAYFDSIDSEITNRNDVDTTFCYHWDASVVPAEITVFYRVKDGYDPTWYATDTITVNTQTGTACVVAHGLLPNQVEYETYIHVYTPSDGTEWDGDTTTFITPLIPEPEYYICENLKYLAELLCESVKRLYRGVKNIYANPASREECDPYSEEPTMLTLWSRALRFFHALECVLEGMNAGILMQSKPGQYFVAEYGWVDPLNRLEEWLEESELWRLASGMGVTAYVGSQMHKVWHYHRAVDVLVESVDELADYPDARSAIVKNENKLYKYENGKWVVDDSDTPDNFAVYHINDDSKYAYAGTAYYYWEGTWNNLDADVSNAQRQLEEISKYVDMTVATEDGAPDTVLKIVDEDFDPSTLPDDGKRYLCLVEGKPSEGIDWCTVTFAGLNKAEAESGSYGSQCIVTNMPEWGFLGQKQDICGDETFPICPGYALDGVGVEQTVPAGHHLTQPPDPKWVGYRFVGWRRFYLTDDGWKCDDDYWDFETPIMYDWNEKNWLMCAQWEPRTYDVWVDWTPGIEGPYPDGPLPTFPGRTIAEWEDANNIHPSDFSSEIDGDEQVVGWEWEGVQVPSDLPILDNMFLNPYTKKITTVTITFHPENGEPDFTAEYQYGDTVLEPDEPKKQDHLFSGWYFLDDRGEYHIYQFGAELACEDTDLYAQYVPEFITVEFDTDGGSDVPSQTIPYETGPTKPDDPTKEGFVFNYWADPHGGVFDQWAPNGRLTTTPYVIKAIWKEGQLTVTFDPNNGNPVRETKVDYNSKVDKPVDPVNGRCKFLGWFEEE